MMRSLFDSLRKLNKDKTRQRAAKALCLVLVTILLFSFWQIGITGIATTYANAEYAGETEGNPDEKANESGLSLPDGTLYDHSDETSAFSWIQSDRKSIKKAPAKAGRPQRTAPNADVPLDDYITDVSGSGTTKVDENLYQTTLEIRFKIETELIDQVKSGGYKFYFDLPEEVIIPPDLLDGGPYYAYLLDRYPELEVAFTYDFVPMPDGTTRIEIVYDDAFIQDALDGQTEFINNVLRCRCFINAEGDDTHDGLDISFTVDKTLEIPPDEINENYDITAQKTGSYTADGKLHYDVTVSSVNGTPSDIAFMDTLTYSGTGSTSPPTEITVIKHNADGTVEVSTVAALGHLDVLDTNIYEITLNLPQLDEHEYYTISYEYAVSGVTDESQGISAYNTAEVNSNNGHDSVSNYADYLIYKQQRQKLGKQGIPYDEYVQWVISVNDRNSDIAGQIVYDDNFANAANETINGTNGIYVQKGWQAATPGVDYEYVYNNDGDIIGVRFLPADGSTPNTNNYHLTYYTVPDVAYGETGVVHNEAEFDGDTASYDVVVTGGDIDKTSEGDQSLGGDLHGMDWTVTVQVPTGGIESGTTFTDTLSPAGHYMSQAQYNALVTALQTAWSPNSVTVTPTYTDGNITGYTFSVGAAGNGYLLDDGLVENITWTYQTTGDMTGKASASFVNTFSDGNKTLPVSHNISPNVKKLNVQQISDWQAIFSEDPQSLTFTYEENKDDEFVWVAQVTPTPGLTQYRVTDTLPEGVELVDVKVMPGPSITAWNYGKTDYPGTLLTIDANGAISGDIGNLWMSRTSASGQLSTGADGRQVVDITLTANSANSDLFNSTFYVVYYCKLSEDAWPTNGTVHLTLNNTVHVESNGDDYGEADNTIIIDATNTQKVVDKTGVWDKNSHMITYSVDINPSAENLLTSNDGTIDPDWLLFTDILSYQARQGTGTGEAVLSLNSVLLEVENNGVWSPVPNVQWTAHTETDSTDPNTKNAYIEMRIPDEAHLRLTYSYHINSSMADGITLSNSATVEGHGEEHGEENTHISGEDFQTSGESSFEEFCLIKIDQENGTPLSGAVFTVYTWDTVNNEWSATEKTYTTDQFGRIIIKVIDKYEDETQVYQKDTAYSIMETAAPPGYILPENPPRFYFWFSENESAPPNAPSDFMLTAADISSSSFRIEAENELDEDIPNTGIFDIRLLPSFVALLITGAGTVLFILRINKKKRYGSIYATQDE